MTAIDEQNAGDVQSIKALIQAFFDSINAADTKTLATHFLPSAGLTIVRQDPPLDPSPAGAASTAADQDAKLTVVTRTNIETFVKLLEDGLRRRKGQPPGPVIHEAPDLEATEVRIDALFASAWSPFRVTFDGKLHHYGTFVYTFGKTGAGADEWKIEGLTQNYRRTPGWPEGHGTDLV